MTTNVEEEMTDSERYYEKGYFLEYNCMEDPMKVYFSVEAEKSNPLASPLLSEDLSHLPRALFYISRMRSFVRSGITVCCQIRRLSDGS